MLHGKRRKLALMLVALAALAAVGGAVAFYLAQGSGSTSSGAVPLANAPSATLTVTRQGCASGCSNALMPGDQRTFNIHVTNDQYAGNVLVGKLTGTVDTGSLPASCDPSWFSVDQTPINQTLTNGASLDTTATVHFNNVATNQNACAGANISFTLNVTP